MLDTEWDGRSGVTNLVIYAMRAQRYVAETDATVCDLAEVAAKNRAFAAANPVAHHRSPVTVEEVLASPMVAEPLTLFQCSPKSDGAAAVLLMSGTMARRVGRRGPRVDLAEVDLGLGAEGMRLRHHHLGQHRRMPAPRLSDIATHRRLPDLRVVLGDKPLPHPPCRVPLLTAPHTRAPPAPCVDASRTGAPTHGSTTPPPADAPCGSARTTPPSTSWPSAHGSPPASRPGGTLQDHRWGQIRRAQPAQVGPNR